MMNGRDSSGRMTFWLVFLEKEMLYPDRKNHYKMTEETLALFVQQHIAAQDVDEVIFAWQGGEPTLMGLPFYRQAVALQQRYANGKAIVNNFSDQLAF
ncbi:hypothetical protein A3219_18910 [Salmonella enterica]|nr:hypothetical protein A3219_18910 [Salmonella enterica]